ncbi:MAG TPA: DUF1206 domain-containing protein [Frankiaceae bacterium]|jgi:hypothetical protein|nr:DUF1206 domain-containing protein [Frankiaceae bacterium]
MATAAGRGARKAAGSDGVQRLARLGLLGRGVLYVVVAILAANIARGSRAEADRQGALRVIGDHGLGRIALAAVAVGFAGYALWRVLEATVRPGDKGWPGRGAALAKAALYTGFAITTAEYVLTRESESANHKHMGIASRVLGWPLGRWIVAAFGVALVAAGLFNVYRGVSGRFRKHLKEHELAKEARPWVFGLAVFGLVARGVAFSLVGFFVVQAAVTYDAKKAQGLDASLRSLARAPYGRPLLLVVAAGLVSFGLWCFVESRYRTVLDS